MPALLRSLRREIPSVAGAFFWVDAIGEITHLYAERMPAPEVLHKFFARRRDKDAGRRFRERLLAQVRNHEPVLEVCADAALQSTPFYRDVLQPLGAHRRLYGVVAQDDLPIGLLALTRPAEMRCFRDEDCELVEAACRYLPRASGSGSAQSAEGTASYRESGPAELLLCSRAGEVQQASAGGYALLAHASGCPINRETAAGELQQAGQTLIKRVLTTLLTQSASQNGDATNALRLRNEWGLFRLRAYEAGATVGVLIERYEHLLVRLVDAMSSHELSTQQGEVLLLLARGLTHADMAEQLSVTVNTVDYHVRQLFGKLGVHNRDEAIAAVLDGHTAH